MSKMDLELSLNEIILKESEIEYHMLVEKLKEEYGINYTNGEDYYNDGPLNYIHNLINRKAKKAGTRYTTSEKDTNEKSRKTRMFKKLQEKLLSKRMKENQNK